jgi:TRAP-type mannitol/chloroaromatic compound transport system permease small subunit
VLYLFRNPLWLFGWVALAGAFVFQALALHNGLISVVQPLLATELVFMLVLIWLSVPYAARSWAILEHSQEASGLPIVFALKTLIPLFAVLMALQGLAQAIRAAVALSRTR